MVARTLPARTSASSAAIRAIHCAMALASGFARAYLSCLSDRGTLLAIAPDGGGAAAPNDGRWHPITIAALCPTATRALRIDLRHSGSGPAYFRTITVHSIAPVEP